MPLSSPDEIRAQIAEQLQSRWIEIRRLFAAYSALDGTDDALGFPIGKALSLERLDDPERVLSESSRSLDARTLDLAARELTGSTGRRLAWIQEQLANVHSVTVTQEHLGRLLRGDRRFEYGAKGWWKLRAKGAQSP